MKRNLLFIIALLAFFSHDARSQASGLTAEETVIRDLEMKWMTAVAEKDSGTLQQLLAPNFELAKIGGNAKTNIKRDKWISNYMQMNWGRFAFKKMQIRVDGNLAFVNADLSFRLRPYPFRLSSGVLDIWRNNNGVWQVEKRYLSEDNLTTWLHITEGIAIGLALLWIIRAVRRLFERTGVHKRETVET
jgi:hypothetical protein